MVAPPVPCGGIQFGQSPQFQLPRRATKYSLVWTHCVGQRSPPDTTRYEAGILIRGVSLQFLKTVILAAPISGILFGQALYGQAMGRNYGRSMVISQQGIAATSQVLAS